MTLAVGRRELQLRRKGYRTATHVVQISAGGTADEVLEALEQGKGTMGEVETEQVTAENVLTGEVTHTNTAYFVYVALDDSGCPTPVPPLICETAEEKASTAAT